MLAPQKYILLTIRHVWTALTAVAGWWMTMSDVEKRQAQQRALGLAACAAMVAVGGPLVSYRAELRKVDETYKDDAFRLAQSLSDQMRAPKSSNPVIRDRSGQTETRDGYVQLVNYRLDTVVPAQVRAGHAELVKFGTFVTRLAETKVDEKAELNCLAEAVYYEARSEDAKGQLAVAEVVLNRVRDPNFPKTICGVVYQGRYRVTGCQFTFTCDGALGHKPRGEAWGRARAVALHARLGLGKPVTNGATHYHTNYVDPYWAPSLVETKKIGTHIFYRLPETQRELAQARVAMAAYYRRREPAPDIVIQPEQPEAIEIGVQQEVVQATPESIAL